MTFRAWLSVSRAYDSNKVKTRNMVVCRLATGNDFRYNLCGHKQIDWRSILASSADLLERRACETSFQSLLPCSSHPLPILPASSIQACRPPGLQIQIQASSAPKLNIYKGSKHAAQDGTGRAIRRHRPPQGATGCRPLWPRSL